MYLKFTTGLACLWLLAGGSNTLADPMIFESFTDYPDNALISTSPAGPALGLMGDWTLDTESHFYVNRTEADLEAGTGKAVYDFAWDDNGAREAFRLTSNDHVLFSEDGDVFFASFLIQPARVMGHMLFTLILDRLDGGGQPDISFGMKDGQFIIGHGGVSTDISDGTPTVTEMLVVLRIEYGDGASGPDDNELLTLWVDPLNESSIPVIDSLPVDILNSGGGKIIAVAIRGEHMAGQPAFFDNLRVGLKFQDVTTDVQLPVLSPDYSINGMFFDSNNPGHGLNLSAHTHGFTVFYYGHTSNGERLWLQSEVFKGDIEFGVPIELEMFEVVNGVFGQPVPPETYWGMLTINLDDCDSGYALFSGIDGNLEMDLMRLTRLPDVGCQK